MTPKLRLGMIGMSEGNGHPYSWSAIFNGYNPEAMATCPFPAIPEYLCRQHFPEVQLTQAQVTHIWTQDSVISEHIAQASLIPTIVTDFEQMIGQVDAVLLARDDAENHLHFARPFLEAGLPIYIDKPLAHTKKAAQELLDMQKFDGQLFSCSSLKYSLEVTLTEQEKNLLGPIRFIEARVPKYWPTYAVHMIEPVLDMLEQPVIIKQCHNLKTGDITQLQVVLEGDILLTFTCTGNLACPPEFVVTGARGRKVLSFTDSFTSFRNTLQQFLIGVTEKRAVIPVAKTLQVIELIEAGLQE